MKKMQIAGIFFFITFGNSIADQTEVVIKKVPHVETFPVGQYQTLICNISRPPDAPTLYWEKIQDVTVPIYRSNNGNVIYQDSSPNIRVAARISENEIQLSLNFTPIRGIDAGVYRCGYASAANLSLNGSKSVPILSISNVGHANVSLTAITDEVSGVFHFDGPSEVSCRATLQGVGQTVTVEIAGRNTTYDFSLHSSPFEWRGSTDGFKLRVREIQIRKRDFFPSRNGMLICTVSEGRFHTHIASKALNVTGNPGYAVSASMTCYYVRKSIGNVLIACNVFDVDIGDVVDFHWLAEDTPGHAVTLAAPSYSSGIPQVESPPYLAFRAVYVGIFLHTAGLTYFLQVSQALPFVTGLPTVEARVFTTNAGNASFILGDQVMGELSTPPTAFTSSAENYTEITSGHLLISTTAEPSTPPMAHTSSAESYTEFTTLDRLISTTAEPSAPPTAHTSSAESYTEFTTPDHTSSAESYTEFTTPDRLISTTADGVGSTQTIDPANPALTDAIKSTLASSPPDILSNLTKVTLADGNGADNLATSLTICALFPVLLWPF